MSAMEAIHHRILCQNTAILDGLTAGWFVGEAGLHTAPTPQKPVGIPADTIVKNYTSIH
jgi:hypothetical protein